MTPPHPASRTVSPAVHRSPPCLPAPALLYAPVLLFALLLGACDRPFADVGEATVEVISPDLSIATDQDQILLTLRVTSVRPVGEVQADGIVFGRVGEDLWQAELDLKPGLNRFPITSIVEDGPISRDTLDVLRLDWSVTTPVGYRPILFGIGGHAASPLPDGRLVLSGGSALAGSPGSFDAWILPQGGSRFAPARTQAAHPRVGHSATVLPDNRILLVGGGILGNIDAVDQLVEAVEVFDPDTETFSAIPVDGPPVRRMYHTALLRNLGGQSYLVLLGGRGDTRYTPTSDLGIRRDMRTFLFRNDSLIALSPAVGPFIRPVAGHTQTDIGAGGQEAGRRYLVAGVDLEDDLQGVSLVMDFEAPAGIDLTEWPPLRSPRIRHASVPLAPGYILHLGGRHPDSDEPLTSGEIQVSEARASFYLPSELEAALTPTYGGTATVTPDGTVVLIGGFNAAGEGLSEVDFVSLSVQ